jgi:hypothetical protein
MASSPTENRPIRERYRVTLRHGAHQWTFTFASGDEVQIVRRVRELANDPDCPLDWHDASAIREQIGRLVVHSGGPVTDPDTSGRAA